MTSGQTELAPGDVLTFWQEAGTEKWFAGGDAFDAEIRERFDGLVEKVASGDLDHWADTPDGALALILVLDQFSRNLFRGSDRSFSQDGKALALAKSAIARGDASKGGKAEFEISPVLLIVKAQFYHYHSEIIYWQMIGANLMPTRSKSKTTKHKTKRALPPVVRGQLALCAAYPELIMFLDIETTGLSHYCDEITVVGWSIEGRSETFIRGGEASRLLADGASATVLGTFYGIRFDARFLRQEFPTIKLPSVHVDLMYLCRRVGLTGGQKSIETELDLNFRLKLEDVDGFAAVNLWHEYLRGDIDALPRLIRYNRADIAAMGALFDNAVSRFILEPDLFSSPIRFEDWPPPAGWNIPPIDLGPASSELSHAPPFQRRIWPNNSKKFPNCGNRPHRF